MEQRRHAQGQQADLDRPNSLRTGLQRVIDTVGVIVAVRSEHLAHRTPQPAGVVVVVFGGTVRLLGVGRSASVAHRTFSRAAPVGSCRRASST